MPAVPEEDTKKANLDGVKDFSGIDYSNI